MAMTRQEILAIKRLPEKYVKDGLRVYTWDKDHIIAACPDLPPIETIEGGDWKEIIVETSPRPKAVS